jgi:hypothetical protein
MEPLESWDAEHNLENMVSVIESRTIWKWVIGEDGPEIEFTADNSVHWDDDFLPLLPLTGKIYHTVNGQRYAVADVYYTLLTYSRYTSVAVFEPRIKKYLFIGSRPEATSKEA